ncbi:MAG: entericidin A/B family lipoprotein [Candidatus Omnitrophica bacterium]|nr:entericidin A/B family lipoprotein [Candidatus Omnitrophota bacterium]
MRSLLAIVLIVGLVTAIGCNTMSGMGKDLEQTGENISEEAQAAN